MTDRPVACRLCGRTLTNPKSRDTGIGPVCAHKEAAFIEAVEEGGTPPPLPERTVHARLLNAEARREPLLHHDPRI